MPWVRFVRDFDYRPRPQVMIAYKAGMVELVKQECATQAIGKKAAVQTKRPAGKSNARG